MVAWLWSIPLVMGLLVLMEVRLSPDNPLFLIAIVYMLPAFLLEMIVGRSEPLLTMALFAALVASLTWFVWRRTRGKA